MWSCSTWANKTFIRIILRSCCCIPAISWAIYTEKYISTQTHTCITMFVEISIKVVVRKPICWQQYGLLIVEWCWVDVFIPLNVLHGQFIKIIPVVALDGNLSQNGKHWLTPRCQLRYPEKVNAIKHKLPFCYKGSSMFLEQCSTLLMSRGKNGSQYVHAW